MGDAAAGAGEWVKGWYPALPFALRTVERGTRRD